MADTSFTVSRASKERGNRTVQVNNLLAAIKHDEEFTDKMSFLWISWLPRIVYSINKQVHTITKGMPYKLFLANILDLR